MSEREQEYYSSEEERERYSGEEQQQEQLPYSSDDELDSFYAGRQPKDEAYLPSWAQEAAEDAVKREGKRQVEQMVRQEVDDFQEDLERGRGGDTRRLDTERSAFTSKLISTFVYLFGIVGGVVGVIFEKQDFYVLANAWQVLIGSVPIILLCLCFAWTHIGSAILWLAYWACCYVMIFFVWYRRPTDSIFRIPFVTYWAERRARNTLNTTVITRVTHV